jgi:hypothetical protein
MDPTRAEQLALAREEQRLKKEPFKTLITDGLREDTVNALRGWVPPPGAYILLERRKNFLQPDLSVRVGYGLQTINVEERPEQFERLRRQVRKGARVIHYANFPTLNDPNPSRAAKVRGHSGPMGRSPWDALEAEVKSLLGTNPNWKEEKAKIEAERNALEMKLQAAIIKKGSQNDKTDNRL